MLPLHELSRYIKSHHHLPDVPSAAEIEKDGIDVASNQATLLKKIEELTLYLIDQNNRLQEQQRQINDLKHELKQQSARK